MKYQVPIISFVVVLVSLTIVAGELSRAGENHGIIFAHANHTDMDCSDCHVDIERSSLAADRNFPTMDVCGDCHDVESDDDCGVCHRDPDDPQSLPDSEGAIVFSHQAHLDRAADCAGCHGDVGVSEKSLPEHTPTMRRCFACHEDGRTETGCKLCHSDNVGLIDIHPLEWRYQHGSQAALKSDWCSQCHRQDESCLDCHRGDNLTGGIHDLNYMFTHGLDAKSKRLDCSKCHDNRGFCGACHESENRIPLLHSSIAWLTEHGRAARHDIENCASCHDSGDPTCARSGCHLDADGVRGTDPRFHRPDMLLFDTAGQWHDDGDYSCFRCHVDTRNPGQGFCGYCHH